MSKNIVFMGYLSAILVPPFTLCSPIDTFVSVPRKPEQLNAVYVTLTSNIAEID